jgi:hypothetical protein
MPDITSIDPTWIWIALGALAVLVVASLIARSARRSRTDALREKFGSEYDYAVDAAGSRKRAEQDLAARAQEVERHDIRPLTAAERDRYRAEWKRVEQHFIERPTTAVVEADELIADVMRVQGYPMGDFEKYAAHLSVKHPRVVEHYRAGHRVIEGAPGSASTEDLRQSMLHYRALFEELLGDRAGDQISDVPRANEVIPPRVADDRAAAVRDDRTADFNRQP